MVIERSPHLTGRQKRLAPAQRSARAASSSEHFGKEVEHRLPRASVGALVVRDPGKIDLAGPRVGERVHRAAVDDELPIDATRLHLLFERPPLRVVDDGVVGADQREHLASDVGRVLGSSRAQPGVEAHGGLEVGPAPSELEGQRAAEAIADGGQAIGVGSFLADQKVEPGGADGAHPERVGVELADAPHHLVAAGERLAPAVVVEREGDVAEFVGQPLGARASVVVQPGSLVGHQHAGTSALAVGEGQEADHGATVGLVGDVAGGCHGRNVSAAAPRHTGPVRGGPGRCQQVGFPLALLALLVASCSSGPSSPPGHATSSTGGASTGTGNTGQSTATTATPGSTLAPVATSGPLQAGSPIALPFSADRVTAAESPDGAVFAAPQDPTNPAPAEAWVVDGNGPAAVAEHVANGIAALAADTTNFYIATYSNVFSFNRASGNQDGQWTMPPVNAANSSDADLVALAAAGGNVLVSVTQGNTVRVYRIKPASSAGPRLVLEGLGDAVGPDGSIYYEDSAHHLAVRRPNGSTLTGPALADTPNGLGGGVQYLDVVAGDTVWVSEPAGQGLDALYTTYAAATLATVGSYSGSVTSTVVDTAAGPLALEQGGAIATCPQSAQPAPSSCVVRIDPHGAVSDAAVVGAAVTLLGPAPAVVTSDTTTGQFDLVRLS